METFSKSCMDSNPHSLSLSVCLQILLHLLMQLINVEHLERETC